MPKERQPAVQVENEAPELEDERSGIRRRPVEFGVERRKLETEQRKERSRNQVKLNELQAQIMELYSDEPAPLPGARPQVQPGIMERFGQRFMRNRLVKAALVAFGLHLPLTPVGREYLGKAVEMVQKAKSDWEKKGMVIRPQTQAERDAVVARMYERGARSDAKGRIAYAAQMSSRLDSGEDVGMDRMYFDLARFGGEDPERVRLAERLADAMVEKFAARMGEDMDEAFIRSVVMEMYGPDANYEWGQGSTTEYFITKKRNCEAIAPAEVVVFEKLIARLPPEKRKLYQLGWGMEKQHPIATLTVFKPDGSVDRTYYLQPPIKIIVGTRDRTGSPTVPLTTLKRAMVSKEPVRVASPIKPGETVAPSPDIDVATDSPVNFNLKVDGPLRGSDYVQQIAEDRGIKPVKAEPERLVGVQELTLLESEAEVLPYREARKDVEGQMAADDQSQFEVRMFNLDTPNLAQIKEMNAWQGKRLPARIYWGHVENLEPQAIKEMLHGPYPEVVFELTGATPDQVGKVLEQVAEAQKGGKGPRVLFWLRHTIKSQVDVRYMVMQYGGADLQRIGFVNTGPKDQAREFYLGLVENPHGYDNALKELLVEEAGFTLDDLRRIEKGKTKVFLGVNEYANLLLQHPEIVEMKNVQPWINGYAGLGIGTEDSLVESHGLKAYPKAEKRFRQIYREAMEKYAWQIAGR